MLTFPAGLRPISGGFAPITKTLSGGMSFAGIEQVVSTMSDRWGASFTFAVRSDGDVLAIRALLLRLRGRTNTIAVPAFDLARAPWGKDAYFRLRSPGAVRKLTRVGQLDDTIFNEDQVSLRYSLIQARAFAAPAQSNMVRVQMLLGGAPVPGHLFSIGPRLYAIEDVASVGLPGQPPAFDLQIWPWLRADVAEFAEVNFPYPVCEMRLSSDGEGLDAIRGLDALRFGRITLNFDEAP